MKRTLRRTMCTFSPTLRNCQTESSPPGHAAQDVTPGNAAADGGEHDVLGVIVAGHELDDDAVGLVVQREQARFSFGVFQGRRIGRRGRRGLVARARGRPLCVHRRRIAAGLSQRRERNQTERNDCEQGRRRDMGKLTAQKGEPATRRCRGEVRREGMGTNQGRASSSNIPQLIVFATTLVVCDGWAEFADSHLCSSRWTTRMFMGEFAVRYSNDTYRPAARTGRISAARFDSLDRAAGWRGGLERLAAVANHG